MRLLALALCVALCGCDPLWGGFRVPHAGPCGGERSCQGQVFSGRPEVDLLLVIDNTVLSRSRQQNLLNYAPSLLEQLDQIGTDYHIGVVSTDVGSWPAGRAFPEDRGCRSAAGDDGLLQAVACTGRQLGSEARSACDMGCPDPSFVPGDGVPWIYSSGGVTNVPRAVSAQGRDEGPLRALRCMALLGEGGCELEAPLEAARRALDGRNVGFLRSRSALGVLFLTDEDDCSVRDARRGESDPSERLSCLNTTSDPDYRCFNPDFRCLARSVRCTEPIQKLGTKTGCSERDDSYLEPVSTYAGLLQGLRPDGRLLVAGIWPPRLGTSGSRFEAVTGTSGDPMSSYDLNRGEDDLASCYNSRLGIYGRPQLRLSHFASLLPGSIEADVCARNIFLDPRKDDYLLGLVSVGERLRQLAVRCLGFQPLRQGGQPACVVGDVQEGRPAQDPEQPLPVCGGACCAAWAAAAVPLAQDAAIAAACQGEPSDCYCVEASAQPGVCTGGAVAGVWRRGPIPRDRLLSFACVAQ